MKRQKNLGILEILSVSSCIACIILGILTNNFLGITGWSAALMWTMGNTFGGKE